MEYFRSIDDIYDYMGESIIKMHGKVRVLSEAKLRDTHIDRLIENAVFNKDSEVNIEARAAIRNLADALGIRLASIQGLYEAMGRGECGGFTVPAVNIRGITYDTARAMFRSALKADAGAFIFEIAKSEIDYTEQRPSEYAVNILAAAIKEGYRGPVFVQGDHFQVNAKKYAADKVGEINALKNLIKEAVLAGFYNIDIDASTVVDLSKPDVREQQRPNYEITAQLTEYIRTLEHGGITVSVGGEIGEVGGKNSTEEELRAFMDGLNLALRGRVKGISKISVQTGTSHGGVVLPDGTIAKVKVDFDTIEKLSKASREDYGLAGVVQHGASTLPDDFFHVFVERGAAEVHLATGFQNQVYDSPNFPEDLRHDIYQFLKLKHASEREKGQTDEQFIYKTRKKGFGPFKERFWSISPPAKNRIGAELEARFDLLFDKLNVRNTASGVKKYCV
jgi:fructose/tagatose bisphosphate aldolase